MSSNSSRLEILMLQRDTLEMEANAIASELTSPGPNGEPPIGLKDPLVDKEGFPRGDIDLYNARSKRQRLAVINNDYRSIMKEIEKEVSLQFINIKSNNPTDNTSQKDNTNEHVKHQPSNAELPPLAKIDQILENSPVMKCGIMDGDILLSLGDVYGNIPNTLSVISHYVGNHVNIPIPVKVLRGTEIINVTLTPTTWGGRGLLGCHLSPC
jgi:26S proteasome non-ATPase regulatory subunit 9